MFKLQILFLLLITSAAVSAQNNDVLNTTYKLHGPYEVIARDGQYRNTKAGSERDMKAAYTFATNGERQQALAIINAYASTLKRLDGHDAPLCALQCYDLVRAMTLLKDSRQPQWDEMIRTAMLPMIRKFDADSPYANGNWGAVVNRLRMACAIFLDDKELYKESMDYFLYANDNGALPNYVGPTGQCQETGRDQNHAQLGLGMLCDICEMAWQQGDDLWAALDNRLMKGIEYSARYNLGNDVPFQTWKDCTGLYCDWTEPGAMGRGRLWDIYRLPYQHYVERKGLKMPYTKKAVALQEKARKKGTEKDTGETRITQVEGVEEGKKLHQVFTWPAPARAPLKHDYNVFVQPRGQKEWTRVDTYMAKVNAPLGNNKHGVREISYAVSDFRFLNLPGTSMIR